MEIKPTEPIEFDFHITRPLLIVLSGFSGVGKDTVLQALKQRDVPFHFVITATSREKRDEEQDGVDYFFVSRQQFEQMIARGELLEYAVVYEDYKGVPKVQVDQALSSGKDVIMRLDVQGAESIRNLYPEAVLIFLTPANYEEWVQRLVERQTETDESLKVRIDTARKEKEKLPIFDYIVTNSRGQLNQAVDQVLCIIAAEHSRQQHRNFDR